MPFPCVCGDDPFLCGLKFPLESALVLVEHSI